MTVQVICPHCEEKHFLPHHMSGAKIPCEGCGKPFICPNISNGQDGRTQQFVLTVLQLVPCGSPHNN